MDNDDRLAIIDLLFSFARALDEKNWAGYAALYAEDGQLHLPWGDPVSQPELAEDTEHNLGRFARTHHLGGNQQVDVHGDTATSRSYFQATHVYPDESLWTAGGQYDCEFRRDNGTWRFTKVVLTPIWQTGTAPQF